MQKSERRGLVSYEDLMRELEAFEQELLPENRAMAMELMVLEAKIRERFQQMENKIWDRYTQLDFNEPNAVEQELSLADIEAMIPKDLGFMPTTREESARLRKKQTLHTIGLAGALAVATATGVFGLASLLQVVLNWIA